MIKQRTMLSIGVGQASIKKASLLDTYQISKVNQIKISRNEFNSYPLCKYNLARSVYKSIVHKKEYCTVKSQVI